MFNLPRFLRHLFPAVIGLLMLNACGFQLMPMNDQDQTVKLDQFIAEGGYKLARHFEIESLNEIWWHDGQAIHISLLAPAEPGNYPMVVYLPGLGENSDGGRLWREQWAKAGYLVFSVQPEAVAEAFADLKEGMFGKTGKTEEPLTVWDGDEGTTEPFDEPEDLPKGDKRRLSASARKSELHYIGREFFAAQSLKTRIEHVLWAYAQCRQRSQARQGLFARADSTRLLLAGYDLGSQTVSALIGEYTDFAIPATADFKPAAALIISPSADAAAGRLQERYRKITLPFLAVTAKQDKDPYGITATNLRMAIWEHAASTDKYLLLLKQGGHQRLSGSSWSELASDKEHRGDADNLMPDFSDHLRRDSRQNAAHIGDGTGRRTLFGEDDRMPVHQLVAAVVSVSTAFFDSIAKGDDFATLWLTQKAPSWLKNVGRLSGK